NPPIAGGVQGGAAAGYGQFYVLDIESETAQRNLELKPPAIAVPTPVGPVQAQFVFTYDARGDVVQAPFNKGSLDTRRDSLDEPGWKRQTGQHDIFGADAGISWPLLNPAGKVGWQSAIALGNRDASEDGSVWVPAGAWPTRPDRKLAAARSSAE